MSEPPHTFFTATDLHSMSVITALIQGDLLTIAKDDRSVSLPTLIALDIAAETIWLLLEEDGITNGHGQSLSEWLGDDDSDQLRHILSTITGPEGPTFTNPTINSNPAMRCSAESAPGICAPSSLTIRSPKHN